MQATSMWSALFYRTFIGLECGSIRGYGLDDAVVPLNIHIRQRVLGSGNEEAASLVRLIERSEVQIGFLITLFIYVSFYR